MNSLNNRIKIWPLFISMIITLSIGGVASAFTIPQIKGWYTNLNKPSFNPPNWLFGPVWTALYIMIAIAAYLVWEKRKLTALYAKAQMIYFFQLFLNFSWSIVFFGLHQVMGALLIIVLLFISIIINIAVFVRVRKPAGLLLVPYLLWVTFAGCLNFAVYILNK